MCRSFKIVLFMTAAVLFAVPAMAQYTVFVVDDDGDPATTYPTLAQAVATAQAFAGEHRIEIRPGAYSDVGVWIDHSQPGVIREIVGDDKSTVIFTAPVFQTGTWLDPHGTTDLTITGITVVSYLYGIRTYVSGCNELHVYDCIFDDNGADGYDGTTASTLGGGIWVHGSDCVIEYVEVMNGEWGIRYGNWFATALDDNIVRHCYVHNMEEYAMWFVGGTSAGTMNNLLVEDNVVDSCVDYGIQFWPVGATFNNPVIQHNTVTNVMWEGILVTGANGGSILNNEVTGCSYGTTAPHNSNSDPHGGIWVNNCSSMLVHDNTSYDNGGAGTANCDYGIYATGDHNDIRWNCLFNHAGVEGYDGGDGTNVWRRNYFEDLVTNLAYPDYDLDGGMETDTNPWLYDNSAVTVEAQPMEVWTTFDVDVDWTIPGCAELDSVHLAAYSFVVNYDPTVLDYVDGSAVYDEAYLGNTAAGALYTPIAVDEVAGTISFAATNFTEPGLGDARLTLLQFQAIATGNTSITILSDYRDPNNDPIPTGNMPLSLVVEDNTPPAITVTANDPIGDGTYSEGGPGPGPHVDLYVEGTVTDNYALWDVWYRLNDGGGFIPIGPVSGTSDVYGLLPGSFYIPLTAAPAGPNSLNVLVRDQSGNRDSVYYYFTIDRTGPTMTVDAYDADGCAPNAAFTDNTAILVDLTGDPDIAQYEIREDVIGLWDMRPFVATDDFVLSTGDANKEVKVRGTDVYGNRGAVASDWIELDTSPATLSFAISPLKTANDVLAITGAELSYGSQTAEIAYIVSMDPGENIDDLTDCFSGLWAAPSLPFDINLSSGDGWYYIWMNSKERAGNMQTPILDSIELDQTAPVLTDFTLLDQEGDVCSEKMMVDWEVCWTGSDHAILETCLDTTGSWYTWGAFDNSAVSCYGWPWAPTDVGDGTYTRYARITDDVGNKSNIIEASIVIDRVLPTIVTRTIADRTSASTYWSNEATIVFTVTGGDADSLQFGEDGTTYTAYVEHVDPTTYEYTFTGLTGGYGSIRGWVAARDCANNWMEWATNWMHFDLNAPNFLALTINGGATITNNPVVSVYALTDEINPYEFQFSEDPTFTTGVVIWTHPFNSVTQSFTLTGGDGGHTIYVKAIDLAENETVSSASIYLDTGPPSGDFVLQQNPATNPYALPGYTNSLYDNEAVSIACDGDVVQMYLRNENGSWNTGWITVAASCSPCTLSALGEGDREIWILFKDSAQNTTPAWIRESIKYDVTGPSAPGAATGTPGSSLNIAWSPVADAQLSILRYNFTNDYPLYPNDTAPHPQTLMEGIFEAEVADTVYAFPGPHPDIYSFSIWSMDSSGNVSTVPNDQVTGTNYILGDFATDDTTMLPDGCIDFGLEFGALAASYNTSTGSPYFNEYLDIEETSDGSATGYPIPDGDIDFNDLVIFALNYRDYRCGSEPGRGNPDMEVDKLVIGQPTVIADLPDRVQAGTQFSVPIRVSGVSGIMGYHFVFTYDHSSLELVSVEPGAAYESVEQSFFYHDKAAPEIDISSVILGDYQFGDQELVRITFRATVETPVTVEEQLLDVRDWHNNQPVMCFSTTSRVELPSEFALSQNYPNPFNPTTTIKLSLKEACQYELTIYNVLGQQVSVFEGFSEAGRLIITWDASEQSSGIYLYRLTAGSFTATRKMVLLK
ncbi:MAG TPA: cohesin domain-containing protein [Acidobacteriota bacterium]|nr:cohesin domain-containing protein [Acidobacteriota bacterium]